MESRRNAVINVLLAKANLLADNHLAISTEDIPKVFRFGLLQMCSNPKLSVDFSKKSSEADFQVIITSQKYYLFLFF